MFRKEDFAEFTISELLQKVWEITDSLKNNQRVRYWFWFTCKIWCEEYLREKWKPSCLLNLKFILKRIDEQNLLYCPGAYIDSEKYIEFLVRVRDIRKISITDSFTNSLCRCLSTLICNFTFRFHCKK